MGLAALNKNHNAPPAPSTHFDTITYYFGDAAASFRQRLKEKLRAKQRPIPTRGSPDASCIARTSFLDWEPLEVLLEMISDPTERTVGGVPQVMRIYENGILEQFVWRDNQGIDYYGGRRVHDAERFDRRILSQNGGNFIINYSNRSVHITG